MKSGTSDQTIAKDLAIDTNIETLTFSNMANGITFDGMIFDKEDTIGTEPYGYVYDFFEGFLIIIQEFKEKFPDVGLDGDIFVYEYGVMDYVYRQRVYCIPKMKKVKFM